MNDYIYIPRIRTNEEFLHKFKSLYSSFESSSIVSYKFFFEHYLIPIKKIIESNKKHDYEYLKKFLNVFPVMEYKEGFELFCSESGYEIMDILHFFVQNYCNKNMKT